MASQSTLCVMVRHAALLHYPSTFYFHAPFKQSVAVAGKCQLHGVDNVGTVPAAVTAYLAVHEFKPDLVISVGTAGGFKARGAAIGDVFLATAFANHDRRIPIPVKSTLLCCCT